MKIRTSCHNLFGPNDLRWSALDDDTYDGAEDSGTGHMIGWGSSEQEAIDDLKRLFRENSEYEADIDRDDISTLDKTW